MEENKKLVMGHVILYAKGWYKHSNEVWKDYRRAIIADGRYTPYTRHDVARLLLAFVFENAKKLNKGHLSDPLWISEEIRGNLENLFFWRDHDVPRLKKLRGMNLDDCTVEGMYDNAVIMTCHSIMEFSELSAFDKILAPSDKVLPLKHPEEDQDENYKKLFGDKNWYDEENESTKYFYEHFDHFHGLSDDIKNGEITYND